MREYRARKRGEKFSLTSPPGDVAKSEKAAPKNSRADSIPTRDKLPTDPAGVFAEWCERKLRIPPGHENQGKPFLIPDYGREFIADALEKRESLLCLGRKNAKSAIVAAYLLARLAGPLRFRGYRGGVASLSREKAGELKTQMEDIARASGLLDKVYFRRSPAPGRVVSEAGSVDILSADRSAGQAAGFDDAICDELGLFPANARALVNGMRSSISARDGRFIALSVWGDAPFIPEIVARREDQAVAVHLYRAPEGCALDDGEAWRAANPGLDVGIKSWRYMVDEARRVLLTPADQADFRAFDLNLPQTPSKEMICSVADWSECLASVDADMPPREGRAWCGFDLGGSSSMSAFCAMWENGRIECWGAFPDTPLSLRKRGQRDGVGGLYELAHERGELWVYPGRVVPVGRFLHDCAERLRDCNVVSCGFDRYRKAEALGALEDAGVRWRIEARGTGASTKADGSFDVRAFQRGVQTHYYSILKGGILTSAIAESEIDRDARGNPALSKRKANSRIDALSAAVIAAGLREKECARKPARRRRSVLV